MTEREKIIEGLERRQRFKTPDGSSCVIPASLLHDAIALLKAQEPIEPVVDVDVWRCGNCGHVLEHQEMIGNNILFHEQYAYCPNCGRPVKWND